MTSEKQRIAIAEACGLKVTKQGMVDNPYDENERGFQPAYKCCPNYISDLNAMHEALHSLKEAWQVVSYRQNLAMICGRPDLAIDATASQRAEAFLRTIGKWED